MPALRAVAVLLWLFFTLMTLSIQLNRSRYRFCVIKGYSGVTLTL